MNSIMWLDIAWFLHMTVSIIYGTLVIKNFLFSRPFIYLILALSILNSVLIIVAISLKKL